MMAGPSRYSETERTNFNTQLGKDRNMMRIRCQDTEFATINFDACEKELQVNQARFQTPLHLSSGIITRRASVPCIRLHDLVVEFDETKTPRTRLLSLLLRYGCRERAQDAAAFTLDATSPKQPETWLSVITTEATGA